MVTDAGTVAALSLLESAAANPPEPAAEFTVTVHVSFPAPVIDPLAQVSPLNVGRLDPLDAEGFNFRAKVSDVLPALAVSVAVCAELTAAIVAVKLELVAPGGIINPVAIVTALLLLDR